MDWITNLVSRYQNELQARGNYSGSGPHRRISVRYIADLLWKMFDWGIILMIILAPDHSRIRKRTEKIISRMNSDGNQLDGLITGEPEKCQVGISHQGRSF